MQLCNNQSHSAPDQAAAAAAEPDVSMRVAAGFYRTTFHLFYVTDDGRVFLVGTPGEPVCLRPRDDLPADAVRAPDVTEAAHHLVADTAEQLTRPRRSRLRAEAARDQRMLAATLLQELLEAAKAEIGSLLIEEHPLTVDRLQERVDTLLDASRASQRSLDNQRINGRGNSPALPPPTATIPRLALSFRHRGEFVGWFTGMRLASEALGVASIRDAHLRGELWTIADGGLLYVFRPAGSVQ